MKFFKTIWFPVLLSIVITVSIVFVMMNNVLNKKAQEQAHGAPSEPVAPTSPVKYPGKLTDELRNFVAELEARDAEVRQKEEDLESIRHSIKQESREFEKLKLEVRNLQAEFDRKTQDLMSRYNWLEQKEQENYRNLADTIESLSPSAAVTLFLQMNKDMDQEPPQPYPANYVNKTILGVLNLMDSRDIAPIFEEMNDEKSGTEESRQLAASLAQQLQRVVVEEKPASVAPATGG